MKIGVILVVALMVLAGYFALYRVATARHDPAQWHSDPLTTRPTGNPNSYRVAPEAQTSYPIGAPAMLYDVSALELAQVFDDFALEQPNTMRIAGLPKTLMITYVQTSKLLKMPDYITVKFIPVSETKTTLAIYSRARFGYGDMGVNRRRVEKWLGSLASYEQSAS